MRGARLGFYAIAALIIASPSIALSLDSTTTLPARINSPQLRMGTISGVGERYVSNGSLVSLSDHYSMEFDSNTLSSVEPRIKQLVEVLNQFGKQEMGSALNLGTLKIDTRPDVRYMAPLHAYGITSKWTVAVGLPIVEYKNDIQISSSGSNLSSIRSQVYGVSPELDEAFDELEGVDLTDRARTELSTKGYKPLESRDETIIGDVQLANLYRVYSNSRFSVLSRTLLNLPTGPGDDPDDLADLAMFGQTYIEEAAIANYQLFNRLRLSAKAAYRFNLENSVVKRVPKNEKDTLPDADTKEDVRRKVGDTITIGSGFSLEVINRWFAGAAYEVSQKLADQYTGSKSSKYDLLSKDTNSEAHRMRLGLTYDSTTAYQRKEAWLPAMISYEYSDTIRGLNIERQTIHEIWLTLFF
ncbi:MAG TPA: transporter [Bdellovibrionales bacterium]|nr:transporter [Bdellovibrionales bacterium]